MKKILLLTSVFIALLAQAQTQTIRGNVSDKESHQRLSGITITILTSGPDSAKTAETDGNGEFVFPSITIGRQSIQCAGLAYRSQVLNNIIVTSAKEVVMNIEMEEEILEIQEVKIIAKPRQVQPNNENALVSARLFTVDETDRFAGSRGDPARMASNFAGVQGADDSRNDIVVRGNSPQGVLWRLEGIDIPNPNHFAIPGTTGGPVSIINNKILGNSDFFTGAFPAEYGNSTAGAFDLKMRNGNNKKREYSTQFGFLGWDLLAEGPFSKNSKASYMATYRYSTLALFNKLNVQIGTDAVPAYQDASFKLNFPMGKKANLSFFGIGGSSNINILISNKLESGSELYGDNDRDQHFGSRMGVAGSVFNYNINKKSYLRTVVAVSHQNVNAHHELVFRHVTDTFQQDGEQHFRYAIDSTVPNLYYTFRINTTGINTFVNTKINSRSSLRYGFQLTRYGYKFQDSNRNFDFADTAKYWKWYTRWNSTGTGLLVQPYIQTKWQPLRKLIISAGVTSQIFYIKDDASSEHHTHVEAVQPRLGVRYQLAANQSINFGAGFHSQIQPAYTYFYILPGNTKPHNLNMGMTRSRQLVLGYDRFIGKDKHLKVETYYQALSNIPVEIKNSSFSLANTGSGFSRFFPDSLKNTGTGVNYGIEFSFDKAFTHGYYYLATLSLFEAKYRGSDGVLRNSDFNTNYAFNTLVAKEWKLKKKSTFNLGGKLTLAGARRYSPIDTLASRREREYVEIDAQKNTLRFGSAYARFDLRLSYKINAKHVTHEFAIDIVNVTNRHNILKYSYISEPPYFKQEYQLGMLPLFYYKLDF